MDPLNSSERSIAARLAAPSASSQTMFSTRRLGASATSSAPEPAILLIERRPINKNKPDSRLADVFVYDYASNELERSIIDLNTRTLVDRSRSQGTQLPLIQAEIDRAETLLFDDEEQFRLINQEYQRIIGQPLTNPAQLHVKAFTFHADNLPQKVNQAAAECGIRRCAQLLIYTDTNIIFEITPIIDLSANVVIQNIGF